MDVSNLGVEARRSRFSTRLMAGLLLAGTLVLGGCSSSSDNQTAGGNGSGAATKPVDNANRGAQADVSSGEGLECKAPELAPTYLPWRMVDSTEPFLTVGGAPGISRIHVWMPNDEDAAEGVEVANLEVELYTREVAGWNVDALPNPPVPVRGTDGHLVWIGEPGDGPLVLFWEETLSDDDCRLYHLVFPDTAAVAKLLDISAPSDDLRSRLGDELVKVAENLDRL